MSDQLDIKRQLQQWAQAYGGSQFERLGYVGKDRLQRSEQPLGDTVPDRIERIVQSMEAGSRWKEARVLRAEFFMGGLAESERLTRLSRVGLRIGRSAYYAYLNAALAFVEGAVQQHAAGEAALVR